MQAETFALIVGGGPVGLAAAIELAWRSVPAVLVTDKLDTAQHPKCNNTNARSMEHFRRLGIADELRSEGLPADVERASAYVTRFCGHEFGRLPRPYSDWPTPEIPNNVSQIVLERVLRRHAECSSTQVHFGWRLDSFTAHGDHVAAEIEHTQTGERRRIDARYLLGIDGAAAADARGVPLKTLRLEAPDGLYRRKLALVRPDQHIAWHGDAVTDATAVIDRLRFHLP